MKPMANNVALALSFFICLSFFPSLNAVSDNKLVNETCQKVREKDLCISSLSAEHASRDAKDVVALGLIAINVAANNGSNTTSFIRQTLLESAELMAPTTEQNFEDCSDNFEDAMQELDDALAFITSRDFKSMKTEIGTAMEDASECASVLNQSEGKDMELYKKTKIFRQLVSIVYDIANMLAPK